MERLNSLFDSLLDFLGFQTPHSEPNRQVLLDIQVSVQRLALEQHGEAPRLRWVIGNEIGFKTDVSRTRPLQPSDEP